MVDKILSDLIFLYCYTGTDKDTAMKLYIYNVKRIDPSFSWEEEQVGTDTQVYVMLINVVIIQ